MPLNSCGKVSLGRRDDDLGIISCKAQLGSDGLLASYKGCRRTKHGASVREGADALMAD